MTSAPCVKESKENKEADALVGHWKFLRRTILEATERTSEWTKSPATHGETWWNGVNKNAGDKHKLWKDCGNWETKTRKDTKRQKEIAKQLHIRPNISKEIKVGGWQSERGLEMRSVQENLTNHILVGVTTAELVTLANYP